MSEWLDIFARNCLVESVSILFLCSRLQTTHLLLPQEMSAEQLRHALDVMRRMPPSSTAQCVDDLCDLVPDLTEELLSTVDQPLKVATDSNAQNREFLLCDYNRDGDSYRCVAAVCGCHVFGWPYCLSPFADSAPAAVSGRLGATRTSPRPKTATSHRRR